MEKQRVNPFYHRLNFTKLDYIKVTIINRHFVFYFVFFIFQIALGTIFLFPIRLIIVFILFLLNSLLAKIFVILLDKWDLNPEQHFKWRFVWL